MGRHRLIRSICIPCMIMTAYNFVKLAEPDEDVRFELMKSLTKAIAEVLEGDLSSYMEVSFRFYERLFSFIKKDPFVELKRRSNEVAKSLIPLARKYLESSSCPDERIWRALKVAAIGNMLDFGTGVYNVSLEAFRKAFKEALAKRVLMRGHHDPVKLVMRAQSILYVADNAGEIVFDTLALQEIANYGKELTLAVRGGPVQNDATLEDALDAGADQIADVITTGARLAGILPRVCSSEFLRLLRDCDLVILKGQGNYQSLDEIIELRRRPIVCILSIKCNPVADDLDATIGDLVIKTVSL